MAAVSTGVVTKDLSFLCVWQEGWKEGPPGHPVTCPHAYTSIQYSSNICTGNPVIILLLIKLHMLQAEKLVSKFEELGSVTGDLGLSAIALAKFEDADGAQAGAYTDSAMASRTLSADSKRVGMVRNPLLTIEPAARSLQSAMIDCLQFPLQQA